jgi:hypothetical protein
MPKRKRRSLSIGSKKRGRKKNKHRIQRNVESKSRCECGTCDICEARAWASALKKIALLPEHLQIAAYNSFDLEPRSWTVPVVGVFPQFVLGKKIVISFDNDD